MNTSCLHINHAKYRELTSIFHRPEFKDSPVFQLFLDYYKCKITTFPGTRTKSILLEFNNKQDMIWFKLKYL